MPKRQSKFMQWLHKHYEAYLSKKQTEGGFCPEWVNEAIKAASADPDGTGFARAGAEMLARTCQQVWQNDPAPEQLELFSVSGIEVLPSYTFADPNTDGGYRRVAARWATPRHAQGDQFNTEDKAREATMAARRKAVDVAGLFAAAHGDPDVLLWNLRDGQQQQAA
jgi:hypothetical protein